jgi:hypothetical protein
MELRMKKIKLELQFNFKKHYFSDDGGNGGGAKKQNV